jgi:hypothetical protein
LEKFFVECLIETFDHRRTSNLMMKYRFSNNCPIAPNGAECPSLWFPDLKGTECGLDVLFLS